MPPEPPTAPVPPVPPEPPEPPVPSSGSSSANITLPPQALIHSIARTPATTLHRCACTLAPSDIASS